MSATGQPSPGKVSLMNCKRCQTALPDLLLDPTSPTARAAQLHLSACPACQTELAELQSAFSLLDSFQAPEPSPWFDTRLAVRLREAQAAPPASLWQRLRDTVQFSTGRHLRPALAGALALVLLAGGGTAAQLAGAFHHAPEQASATVQDLQILDRNDQAFQTMDQLLDEPSTPSQDENSGPNSPAI